MLFLILHVVSNLITMIMNECERQFSLNNKSFFYLAVTMLKTLTCIYVEQQSIFKFCIKNFVDFASCISR